MNKDINRLQQEARDLFLTAKNGFTYQFLGATQNRSNTYIMSYFMHGFGQSLRMDIEIVIGVSNYRWLDFVYPSNAPCALWLINDNFLEAWKNDKVEVEFKLNS